MASHTIRQRANPHCQTRVIIQNVDCNSKCEPFHFDDANNANRTTPFPTRSNREYLQDKLELGNMDSYRDWGHSKDYVRDENYARENKLGIWQGKFIRPEKWRKLN